MMGEWVVWVPLECWNRAKRRPVDGMEPQESIPRLSQISGFNPSMNPSEPRFVTRPPVFRLFPVIYAISTGSTTRNDADDLYES